MLRPDLGGCNANTQASAEYMREKKCFRPASCVFPAASHCSRWRTPPPLINVNLYSSREPRPRLSTPRPWGVISNLRGCQSCQKFPLYSPFLLFHLLRSILQDSAFLSEPLTYKTELRIHNIRLLPRWRSVCSLR